MCKQISVRTQRCTRGDTIGCVVSARSRQRTYVRLHASALIPLPPPPLLKQRLSALSPTVCAANEHTAAAAAEAAHVSAVTTNSIRRTSSSSSSRAKLRPLAPRSFLLMLLQPLSRAAGQRRMHTRTQRVLTRHALAVMMLLQQMLLPLLLLPLWTG